MEREERNYLNMIENLGVEAEAGNFRSNLAAAAVMMEAKGHLVKEARRNVYRIKIRGVAEVVEASTKDQA